MPRASRHLEASALYRCLSKAKLSSSHLLCSKPAVQPLVLTVDRDRSRRGRCCGGEAPRESAVPVPAPSIPFVSVASSLLHSCGSGRLSLRMPTDRFFQAHVRDQGQLPGRETCVVTQGAVPRRAPSLVQCSALAVMKLLLIFEQGALSDFCFCAGPCK